MKPHYYMTHPVHGRLVTLDAEQIKENEKNGWTLEKDDQPEAKRGPGRPRKVSDEHGAADH